MKSHRVLSTNELEALHPAGVIHLQRALELAERALCTSPNPRVGCVLVQGNDVIAEGWHVAPGLHHAEAKALAGLDDVTDANGCVAYVSLEPCAHHGRTPPCANALVEAGVSRVVIATIDPNPQVGGKGIEILLQAGIEVFHCADFDAQARAINPGYFKCIETGLPWVRCKLAMSLDGRTALADGQSKWITGPEARSDVQRLRARSAAIITGVETVLADDPSLTVRPEQLGLTAAEQEQLNYWLAGLQSGASQPRRVIMDSHGRMPSAAKLTQLPGPVSVFGLAANVADLHGSAEYLCAATAIDDAGLARVDPSFVLESLAADYACDEVLIEAGPTLAGAFISAGLVDELIVYIAPKLMGQDARQLVSIPGVGSLAECPGFEFTGMKQLGKDVKLTARRLLA